MPKIVPHFDKNTPLAPYAYTQAGGNADYLAIPKTLAELQAAVSWARANALPWQVFGRLSNLVVRSGGLRGVTILMHELKNITVRENEVTADAGADLIMMSDVACQHGLSGLEWAAGIPGSVGGAVFMNAGAYGGNFADVAVSVTVLHPDGQILTYGADVLEFGYRQSWFQHHPAVILSATVGLRPDRVATIQAKMTDVNRQRATKQPLDYPSNGSVFKRPAGHFAGKLIMDAGLQGLQVGGVAVSTKHAGFMVNLDQGTGNDYEDLIHLVQKRVAEKFAVTLEPEVRIIGDRT